MEKQLIARHHKSFEDYSYETDDVMEYYLQAHKDNI